jgi:hypothetical protein
MTALTLIQSATRRLGINSPTTISGNQDPAILQIIELANEEGKDMASRCNWQALTQEATFTTVATETQATLATLCPTLKFIINDTIWNRTLRRPVFGPLSPQLWQQRKAMFITGPWNQFRIVGGLIKFIPIPVAGEECYFEWVTKAFCTDSSGATLKTSFTMDDDVPLLDEDTMVLGLVWRWKQYKGFDFTADFAKYESKMNDLIGRDGSKPALTMADGWGDVPPGVFVPAGNWNA